MSMKKISVAVLGTGPLAELLGKRIKARKDLSLLAVQASAEAVPEKAGCVVYLPSAAEIADGSAAVKAAEILKAGINVVSTAPVEALSGVDLLAACNEGQSCFHGSGGFQSRLVSRFNRAFAAITRQISDVELVEELDIEDAPASPWAAPADAGFDGAGAEAALVAEGFYDAGLRILSDAVFKDRQAGEAITASVAIQQQDDIPVRMGISTRVDADQVIVRRSLGDHVVYDSIWSRRKGSATPLRYQLHTRSVDAVGHASIEFKMVGKVRPADHLAATGLLDAIRPVSESEPGILHHDLDFNHVKPDERL